MEIKPPTHVVGIGASAGGLKAIDAFFRAVPFRSGASYVLVQHLSPDFKSLMDEIMARFTELPIYRVEYEMPVEADSIYLIPPKKNMIISESRLLLSEQVRSGGVPALPIDLFLHSLASDFGEKSIAVIMSGTGSDGSRGIQSVHKAGGMVMVQTPDTASFDGMPRAAIDTNVVDVILPPDDMPQAIVKRIHGRASTNLVFQPAAKPLEGVDAVFALLRNECQIDFNQYRDSTISRRLERRIELTNCTTLDQYIDVLKHSPDELNRLHADLLIGTTNFFRNESAWLHLKKHVIPELISYAESTTRELRIWSAGCGTGEEAYSIAMLLAEFEDEHPSDVSIKVFATDVHQQSLDIAARRWFDQSIEKHVSQERLEKFFSKRGNQYLLQQRIRRMVVFAQQNVMTNAPFTNVDLVICRNLLIYFEPDVQRKVLSLFHFSLRRNGVLFLGSSETLGSLADDFEVISTGNKIFSKLRESNIAGNPLAESRPSFMNSRSHSNAGNRLRTDTLLNSAYETALEEFVKSGLLVDATQRVIHIFGDAASILRVPRGQMSSNARDLLPSELVPVVTAAIHKAQREHVNIRYPKVRITAHNDNPYERDTNSEQSDPDGIRYVELVVCPLVKTKLAVEHFLLLFHEPALTEAESRDTVTMGDIAHHSHVDDLESELQFTRESLQAANEELETSNEELQATNEELVAANEELQSTNEELQASNEELQSTNEELHSVNEELHTVSTEHQERIAELTEVTSDLENLLESIDLGVLFLDKDLCVRKYAAAITRTIPLIPRDVGRPLMRLAPNLNITNTELAIQCQKVMEEGLAIAEQTISGPDTWVSMRILPYMDENHKVSGVVLLFSDVTKSKSLQIERDKYVSALEASNQDLQDFAYIASHDLKSPVHNVSSLSQALREDYGSKLDDTGQQYLGKLVDSADRMQKLIEDLLEFSRVQSRAQAFIPVDSNRAVDSALAALQASIDETDANISRTLLPSLAVDESQITQLFQNLIGNALKYRSERVPAISISAKHDADMWKFSVADNGIGIPTESLEKVFTIFYRLHTNDEVEGTGLGLAICRRIVERHNGLIWAESEPNRGSTIYFTLPTDLGSQARV